MDSIPSSQQRFEKLLEENHGIDIPFSNELGDDFEHVRGVETNDNGLNISLLTQDLRSSPTLVSSATKGSQPEQVKKEPGYPNSLNGLNPQALSTSPRATTSLKRPVSRAEINNTNPASVLGYPTNTPNPRPQFLTRHNSNLRYQYDPHHCNRPSSPLSNTHNPSLFSTISPSQNGHLQRYAAVGSMVQQVYQPFEESHLRSSVGQSLHYMHNQPGSQVLASQPFLGHQQSCSPLSHVRSTYPNYSPQLGQPRTPPSITYMGQYQHNPSSSAPTPSGIKPEMSSPGSPVSQRRESRSMGKRRQTASQTDASPSTLLLPMILSPEDKMLVDRLVAAMTDEDDAEDNAGMLKTWDKIRAAKAGKLHGKAVEMLRLAREAEALKEDFSDKKAVHQYSGFQHRYDEMCKAFRSQKTICKHLMEEEYSRIVANDPTYAAQRVRNNRRVNDQKKVAIELGRNMMGERGHGKGRKIEKIAHADDLDFFEEDENSTDEPMSDQDPTYMSPEIKPEPNSRKKAKKSHRTIIDHDSDYTVRKCVSSRKAKRKSRSKHNGDGSPRTSHSTRATRRVENDHNASQTIYSSPASQHSQHVHENSQTQQYGYNNGIDIHTPPHSLPRMLEEHHFGHPHAYYEEGFNRHGTNGAYASGLGPTYSNELNHNETQTNGYGNGDYADDLFGPSQIRR